MVATINMFNKNQVIAYVGEHASEYGLDPAAVLAVANHEGLGTTPGSKWWLPKENNWSFGPPSWYGNGAGAHILTMFGGNSDQASAWSWSPEGLNYWLQQVAQSARGLTGSDAIRAIVTGFERPAAENVPGEIANAQRDYSMFQQTIGTVQVDPTIPAQTPAQTTPVQTPTQAQPAATASAGLLSLGQVGPFKVGVPSGLLLGLLALVLLIVGAIVMNGRENNMQVLQTAAMA